MRSREERILLVCPVSFLSKNMTDGARTIQTEFSSSTVLCIAHRLNTIGAFKEIVFDSHFIDCSFGRESTANSQIPS